jgi:hypothetical protein
MPKYRAQSIILNTGNGKEVTHLLTQFDHRTVEKNVHAPLLKK